MNPDFPTLPRLTPAPPQPKLNPYHAALLQPTAHDDDVEAADAHLSDALLMYSHRGWERPQRNEPLCDVTDRYLQLSCIIPTPPTIALQPHSLLSTT